MDDAKTVLNVRGHPSAVLQKLNFYRDKRFVARTQGVWRFSPLFGATALQTIPEWPLFEAAPKSLQARLAASGRLEAASKSVRNGAAEAPAWGAGPGREIAENILPVAKTVFEDWRRFMVTVERAMIAPDQGLAEVLIGNLKTKPQACGALRGSARTWIGKNRTKRRNALAALPSLARLVARARLDVNDRFAKVAATRAAELTGATRASAAGLVATNQTSAKLDETAIKVTRGAAPTGPVGDPAGAAEFAQEARPSTAAHQASADKQGDGAAAIVLKPDLSAPLDEATSARAAAERLLERVGHALVGTTAAEKVEAARAGLTGSGRQLAAAIAEP
jgi:hypothetical protein